MGCFHRLYYLYGGKKNWRTLDRRKLKKKKEKEVEVEKTNKEKNATYVHF